MKWLASFFTGGILVVIYAHIDRRLLFQYLTHLHPGYFGLALFLFLPQIVVASLRWHTMITRIQPMTLGESIQLVMAGKALNILVPSKLGEMSKAYFLKMNARVDTGQAVSAVILEKVLDMGGLCTMLLLGVLISPDWTTAVWVGAVVAGGVLAAIAFLLVIPTGILEGTLTSWSPKLKRVAWLLDGWGTVLSGWKGRVGTLPRILGLSVLLWGLHVLQIYLFFPSLRHPVPLAPALAAIPLGILVGLLPITIGGIGTRDSALILLFASYADSALMAGIGLLCSMRYWVDTLLGVPFFHRYASRIGRAMEKSAESPLGDRWSE